MEKASMIEKAARKDIIAPRRRGKYNLSLVEQKRPASYAPRAPYRNGFGVKDCEETCSSYPHFGLLCGGFCSGDAHRRAACYCGRGNALTALARHKAPLKCDSTCSLEDERPCGGPGAIAMYTHSTSSPFR